ncbi:hypothetical protein M5K25_023429 [Dendrobium thyrsiflorum]|uniref:Secreted protein n=1 Tax=Dendrobium thyrsiflorum TaxID=117978 RepID=A0ABD0U8R7_DENTH
MLSVAFPCWFPVPCASRGWLPSHLLCCLFVAVLFRGKSLCTCAEPWLCSVFCDAFSESLRASPPLRLVS